MEEISSNKSNPIDQPKLDESNPPKKCLIASTAKVTLVALIIFGGMAIGAGIGFATGGIGFAAIALSAALGTLVTSGLLLLIKISLVFLHAIAKSSNQEVSYKNLSHAAKILKNYYFDYHPDWYKKKIFITTSNDYSFKKVVKNELMQKREFKPSFSNESEQSDAMARFSVNLHSLRTREQTDNPFILADILKEIYEEMNFLNDQHIEEIETIGKGLTRDRIYEQELNGETMDELHGIFKKIPDYKRSDFMDFIELLSNVYKHNNKVLSNLGISMTKTLNNGISNENLKIVFTLFIKHYDELRAYFSY
jgi:uncharacterized membrane protein